MTETNNSNNDWQERECGALWKQKGRNQNFLSGHVEIDNGFGEKQKVKLVVFSNKHKKLDKHPDFRVYLSREREEVTTTAESVTSDAVTSDAVTSDTDSSNDDLI